jgi:cytoskeletal protein CcmA (bactofilin family)
MAKLTLRQVAPGVGANAEYTYKGGPLTHNELDANFVLLDSALTDGSFYQGINVGGGIIVESGGIEIKEGDLTLNNGNIHYNPSLLFIDDDAAEERVRFDSSGSVLIGSSVNSQSVNLKVSRSGNQHALIGCKTSNSTQVSRLELGPAGDGTETGAGIKATQETGNFNDWSLTLFSSNATDGYVDAIKINTDGLVQFDTKVEFNDSATFNEGIHVIGNLKLDGTLMINGDFPPTGTVEAVSMTVPTGLEVTNGPADPITSVGTFQMSYTTGYSIVSPTDRTNWDTAYGWGDHSAPGYLLEADFGSALDSALGGTAVVFEDRTISTSNGIQGGGDLSADRSLSLSGSYTGNFSVTGDISATGDIRSDGNVIAYYNASDERLKENITVIDDALDKVSTLKGVNFNYTASGIQSTGLIAQDLERVLPEAVYEDEDGYKGIRYQITVGLLVEAIKELKAEIEDLKKGK